MSQTHHTFSSMTDVSLPIPPNRMKLIWRPVSQLSPKPVLRRKKPDFPQRSCLPFCKKGQDQAPENCCLSIHDDRDTTPLQLNNGSGRSLLEMMKSIFLLLRLPLQAC